MTSKQLKMKGLYFYLTEQTVTIEYYTNNFFIYNTFGMIYTIIFYRNVLSF